MSQARRISEYLRGRGSSIVSTRQLHLLPTCPSTSRRTAQCSLVVAIGIAPSHAARVDMLLGFILLRRFTLIGLTLLRRFTLLGSNCRGGFALFGFTLLGFTLLGFTCCSG